MLTLSDSAKHTASLSRIALTEYEQWRKGTNALHPTAIKSRSLAYDIEYYTVQGTEDAVALWHHEHQMGYIVLTPVNDATG